MLSAQDAEALSIPLGLFASKDESRDEVRNRVHTWDGLSHSLPLPSLIRS